MGDKTGIAWCDATWNPTRGCSRVSAGCENCYAEKVATRFGGPGGPYDGLTKATAKGHVWTGEVRFAPDVLDRPLRWTKPRRIFVDSMSDLFHLALDRDFIAQVFAVMALASWHTFQVLTKRPERARKLLADPMFTHSVVQHAYRLAETFNVTRRRRVDEVGDGTDIQWPLPNVHLGVSVEDQESADERIPTLLRTRAAVRFLSCEPLLGPVDLGAWMDTHTVNSDGEHGYLCVGCLVETGNGAGIDWVIVGGESGPRARGCDLSWVRALVAQCRDSEVPCFVKQIGSRPFGGDGLTSLERAIDGGGYKLVHRAGADPSEWPEDLRIRDFPR